MGKRVWRVEWKARPAPDGEERLGRAVQLLLDAARRASAAHEEQPAAEATGTDEQEAHQAGEVSP